MDEFRIVLASGSPRRREIFEQVGIEFEVCPSDAEEIIKSTIPDKVCVELSSLKARSVASSLKAYEEAHPDIVTPQDIMVIGADTIVAVDNDILGKPKDENDACDMLSRLSGRKHQVYTGVALVFISKDGRAGEHTFYERTEVEFYPIDKEEIKAYVDTGSPLDKAGAYGIQDMSARFVKKIDGDYYNVVGFPISRFINELKKLGLRV